MGDTTVVRTVSGSVWDRRARLVEELRLGGITAEDDAGLFGDITHAAVAADGTIFLFDPQVPRLSRFSASGEALGAVGREGQGPGEFGARATGMMVLGDRLLLADPDNLRLASFSLDGNYLGSLGEVTGLRSSFSPTLAQMGGDGFAVRILTVTPGPGVEMPDPWPIALERRGADGTVLDTIPPQGPPVGRSGNLYAMPWGGVLVDSDQAFVFDLRREDGSVLRVVAPFERAEYTEAEARGLGPLLARAAQADGQGSAGAPKLKGFYLDIFFSPERRIWARRPVHDADQKQASWRIPWYQPSTMDVFDTEGRYLGGVDLPPRSRPMAVTDTHLFTVELGEFDEPYFVRYRVEG